MYFDTPRDYIGGVYEELLYGDQPLGWDIIGRKETVRGATRDTFTSYLDRWYHPPRMVLGVGGQVGDDLLERAQELLGDMPQGSTGEPEPTAPHENGRVKVFTKQSDQAHLILGVPSYPIEHPGPLRAPGAVDRARRRHVVAPVHRGARAARPRVLRLRAEPQLHRRGLALRAGGRRHQPDRRGGDDDRSPSCATIAAEPVPADELEKAKNFSKGRFVLAAREPAGADPLRPAARGARAARSRSRRGARRA